MKESFHSPVNIITYTYPDNWKHVFSDILLLYSDLRLTYAHVSIHLFIHNIGQITRMHKVEGVDFRGTWTSKTDTLLLIRVRVKHFRLAKVEG